MGILYVSYADACPGNGHVPKRVGKKAGYRHEVGREGKMYGNIVFGEEARPQHRRSQEAGREDQTTGPG